MQAPEQRRRQSSNAPRTVRRGGGGGRTEEEVEARATSVAFVKAAQSRVDMAFAAATCPPPPQAVSETFGRAPPDGSLRFVQLCAWLEKFGRA